MNLPVTERERDLTAPRRLWRHGRATWNVHAKYVFLYLAAIVTANLITTALGKWASVVNAFFLIGLNLRTRDNLHDAWQRKGLWWKMAVLIATGSLLSWIVNRNAGQIAIASFVAFAFSGLGDTIAYSAAHRLDSIRRVNVSNFVGSAIDSFVFPTVAFGWPPDPMICFAQFTAKVAGGLLWSLVIS